MCTGEALRNEGMGDGGEVAVDERGWSTGGEVCAASRGCVW